MSIALNISTISKKENTKIDKKNHGGIRKQQKTFKVQTLQPFFRYQEFYSMNHMNRFQRTNIGQFISIMRPIIIFVNLLYFTSSLLIYTNFVFVAKRWKELQQFWEHTEWLLAGHIGADYDRNILGRKIKIIASVILGIAILEQILDEITGYYRTHECWDVRNRLEAFFKQFFPEFFSVVPYNIITGLFATIIHFYCMISKNYVDLFLIALCKGLKEQFEIVNDSILHTPIMDKYFWSHKWQLFKRVHELLQCVNQKINFLVLLSYATNLYFICVQLLSCMRQKSSAVQGFYLWISLVFIIGRVLILSLSAAQINDESTRILPFIRNLPTHAWNTEVERFLQHLTSERIALSGMNFFALTRSLILKIVSTIVTYELRMT
uniref:CSON001963 protein n=1 Tax=Culicoides sonorensis TaxID=179676 RepID=A0A336MMF3_CULSO